MVILQFYQINTFEFYYLIFSFDKFNVKIDNQ